MAAFGERFSALYGQMDEALAEALRKQIYTRTGSLREAVSLVLDEVAASALASWTTKVLGLVRNGESLAIVEGSPAYSLLRVEASKRATILVEQLGKGEATPPPILDSQFRALWRHEYHKAFVQEIQAGLTAEARRRGVGDAKAFVTDVLKVFDAERDVGPALDPAGKAVEKPKRFTVLPGGSDDEPKT